MTARYPMPADTRDAVMRRNGGRCEAATPVCSGYSQIVHHKAGRAFPECNDERLLLAVCEPCHLRIHAHPSVSYERGWMVKRNGVAVAEILAGAS